MVFYVGKACQAVFVVCKKTVIPCLAGVVGVCVVWNIAIAFEFQVIGTTNMWLVLL